MTFSRELPPLHPLTNWRHKTTDEIAVVYRTDPEFVHMVVFARGNELTEYERRVVERKIIGSHWEKASSRLPAPTDSPSQDGAGENASDPRAATSRPSSINPSSKASRESANDADTKEPRLGASLLASSSTATD